VPECRRRVRDRLRDYLHARGFGYLQNSVWVTPDPLNEERALLREGPVDVESLIILEARPGAGETDAQVVAGGWDFAEINQRYAAHGKVLARRPLADSQNKVEASAFYRWLRLERLSWLNAVQIDPLLPLRLLPSGYGGIDAWRRRVKVMDEVARDIRIFSGKLL
jgi:phenylacetic acid degradation operon negative regulatory protein